MFKLIGVIRGRCFERRHHEPKRMQQSQGTSQHSAIEVVLVLQEVAEPNKVKFVLPEDVWKEPFKRKVAVGAAALSTMIANVKNVRESIKATLGAKNDLQLRQMSRACHLVLCSPIAPNSNDVSIYSLKDEAVRKMDPGPYNVKLEITKKALQEIKKQSAERLHHEMCLEWIQNRESEVKNVIARPMEYTYDVKENAFRHKTDMLHVVRTFTTIKAALVDPAKFNVCIDGYLALKARKAISDEEERQRQEHGD